MPARFTARCYGGRRNLRLSPLTRELETKDGQEDVMQFEIHQEGVTRLTSLRNAGGDWRWELIDDDGVVIASGAGYQSKAACREVVEALKATTSTTPVISRSSSAR